MEAGTFHYHSLSFIIIHYHSLSFINIHYHSLSFIIIHCHSLSFIIIHFHLLSFIIIHYHSLSLLLSQILPNPKRVQWHHKIRGKPSRDFLRLILKFEIWSASSFIRWIQSMIGPWADTRWWTYKKLLKMAIEIVIIVDLHFFEMVVFHSHVNV